MLSLEDVNPKAVYGRSDLAKLLGVAAKTIDRWAKQPSEELPPPFYLKRSPYWMGSELRRFFEQKQARAVEAVMI